MLEGFKTKVYCWVCCSKSHQEATHPSEINHQAEGEKSKLLLSRTLTFKGFLLMKKFQEEHLLWISATRAHEYSGFPLKQTQAVDIS